MSVQTVCVGWHWQPYRYARTADDAGGAHVAPMPDWLADLGRRGLAAAYKNESAAADYRPDVALINFYDEHAKLGMHQDKDEKGDAPVVSLSIGDSCIFRLGNTTTRGRPYTDLELRSGDLLVFGGPSRFAYHGVPRILPGTGDPRTGLRHGRLNLTLRVTGRSADATAREWDRATAGRRPGLFTLLGVTQEEYDLIAAEIAPHHVGSRTESAALLAWFLHGVWRMDLEDVDDAICDGGGDKGIDALVVNEDLREIVVFQSKHRQSAAAGQGDQDLKNLVGAAAYFTSPEAVDGLLASSPNLELRNLVLRQKIRERVADGAHATRLVFVTNGTLDRAGRDYEQMMRGHDPELDVWDQPRLAPVAARTRAPELRPDTVELDAVSPPTTAALADQMELAVAVVPASELVELPGIEDLSLFDRNVRLSEGRTRVNRDLAATVRDDTEHVYFPAYHNGLTLLTHGLEVDGSRLVLDGVTVVNGCQSLLTLHENRGSLTDGLRLLVKVVQVPEDSPITEKITFRSNNQNPVDIRDQRSTDVIQRDLQQQVADHYGGAFAYAIREGETLQAAQVLSNQEAAQLLMAVYLQEPWNAVRKVRLFDTDYRRIFNREVDAHRLYLLQLIGEALTGARGKLRADLAASFASVRFTLAYLLAKVLAETDEGRELLQEPGRWLPDLVGEVHAALAGLLDEVVQSVNFYIEEEERERRERGEEFDPKVVFKSQGGVRGVENVVLRDSRRLAMRDPTYLFQLASAR